MQPNPPACTPAKITLVTSAYQEATVGQAFPEPIAVRVVDDQGRPVPNVTVFFDRLDFDPPPDLQGAHVTFSEPTAQTNSDSLASVSAIAGRNPGVAQYHAYYFRANRLHSAFFVLANRASSSSARAMPIVEFFNPTLGHYFMTGDVNEQRDLDSGVHVGWVRTRGFFPAPSAPDGGTTPVCRFFADSLASHFYSGDPRECLAVIQRWPLVWTLETDAAFHSYVPDFLSGNCGSGKMKVYRLYNGRADANHRYTTSVVIKDEMIRGGWVAEGYGPEAVALCAPL